MDRRLGFVFLWLALLIPGARCLVDEIIDTSSASSTLVTLVGSWQSGTSSNSYNSNHYYACLTSTSRAVFTPTITTQATYLISTWYFAHPNRATAVQYTINHLQGTTDVFVDQTSSGSQWFPVGQFELGPSSPTNVTIYSSSAGCVVADALRLQEMPSASTSPTRSKSATPSPTRSASSSTSATRSRSPTVSPTPSRSRTASSTPSQSRSASPSHSPSASVTPTTGGCLGFCGSSPPGASCKCDSVCIHALDCCVDFDEICIATPSPTPTSSTITLVGPSGCETTMFVTSQTYKATFGGLTGADAECMVRSRLSSLCAGGGLGGQWRALLSTSSTSATARTSVARLPIQVFDAVSNSLVVVANVSSQLWDGSLNAAFRDEYGAKIFPATSRAWTGTQFSGASQTNMLTCDDWATTTQDLAWGVVGEIGEESSTDCGVSQPALQNCRSAWSTHSLSQCSSEENRLICIKVDEDFGAAPCSTTAFVSSRSYPNGGQIGSVELADVECQDMANRAAVCHSNNGGGLPGTWVSLLSNSTHSAQDRLSGRMMFPLLSYNAALGSTQLIAASEQLLWQRDSAKVGPAVDESGSAVDENLTLNGGAVWVWTGFGGNSVQQAATPTCNDWKQQVSAWGVVGEAWSNNALNWVQKTISPCSASILSPHLYCVRVA